MTHFMDQRLYGVVFGPDVFQDRVNQNQYSSIFEESYFGTMPSNKGFSPNDQSFLGKSISEILTVYLVIPFPQIFICVPEFHPTKYLTRSGLSLMSCRSRGASSVTCRSSFSSPSGHRA